MRKRGRLIVDIMKLALIEELKSKMDGLERMLQETNEMIAHNGEMLEELQDSIRELQG